MSRNGGASVSTDEGWPGYDGGSFEGCREDIGEKESEFATDVDTSIACCELVADVREGDPRFVSVDVIPLHQVKTTNALRTYNCVRNEL